MTPQLRFPQFTDEWQVKKLGDIAELTSSKRVYLSDYVPIGIPFYRGKEISELKKNIVPDDILYISSSAYENFKSKFGAPQKNEILITAVGTLGNVLRVKNDEPFYFKDGNLIWLKNIQEDPFFTEIILENGKNKLLQSAIGSSQKALTIVGLNKIKFKFPRKAEQEKIAEFLTAVDERIALMEKKLELLKKYKKGVMQKIFTQQIRFKDENGDFYPDWEERKVIDIYHFRSTNSLSRDCLSDVGRYQNIHYGDIHKRYGTHLDTVTEDIPRIYKAPQVLIEKFIPESTLNAKDIIMADASEDYKDIGKSLEIINTEGITVAGLHTIVMRPYDPSSIVLGFGAYLFNSEQVRRQIMKLATGVSVLGVSLSNLMNVKIGIPSREEQRKIVNVLTALDDKIKEEKARLEFAKRWKKGLLQRMFI